MFHFENGFYKYNKSYKSEETFLEFYSHDKIKTNPILNLFLNKREFTIAIGCYSDSWVKIRKCTRRAQMKKRLTFLFSPMQLSSWRYRRGGHGVGSLLNAWNIIEIVRFGSCFQWSGWETTKKSLPLMSTPTMWFFITSHRSNALFLSSILGTSHLCWSIPSTSTMHCSLGFFSHSSRFAQTELRSSPCCIRCSSRISIAFAGAHQLSTTYKFSLSWFDPNLYPKKTWKSVSSCSLPNKYRTLRISSTSEFLIQGNAAVYNMSAHIV